MFSECHHLSAPRGAPSRGCAGPARGSAGALGVRSPCCAGPREQARGHGLEGRQESRARQGPRRPGRGREDLLEPWHRGLLAARPPPTRASTTKARPPAPTTCLLPPSLFLFQNANLAHARYKTRGPPWVPGWGRGHLHGSMSVILTRAPPGPAGKRLSASCGGGSREGACPRKEHFTSILRLPKVLPSLVVLPLLLEGLLVLPLLPWFSSLPPQMPRSPASGPPFSASLRTAAPVLICLSLWSLGERDLCWTKPPVPAPRTRQTPTGKFRGSQGGSHSKKPLGSEPSGFGSPPASPPCWPCGLLAFKPGRLLFLE